MKQKTCIPLLIYMIGLEAPKVLANIDNIKEDTKKQY